MEDQTSESEKLQQKQKFDEIIDMLLSAGYFRARINTLSQFDKVVGGLCWCITSSGEDVDVDILFQENSTIGQRITLSEAIVNALRKMQCPSPLQPHQIQGGIGGSDYLALCPVIVWLVKKFFERREEREAQLRAFSTLQFSKNYSFPPAEDGDASASAKADGSKLATRLYRRRETKGESEETRVHSCLLEYGERLNAAAGSGGSGGSNADATSSSAGSGAFIDASGLQLKLGALGGGDLSGFEKKLMLAAKEAMRDEEILQANASKEEALLMQQMTPLEGSDASTGSSNVSGGQLVSIVSLGSADIGNASKGYEEESERAKAALEQSLGSGRLGQVTAYKRQRENLVKTRDDVECKAAEVTAAVGVALERLAILDEERRGASDYNQKLQEQLVKLSDLEAASSQQEELRQLKSLVVLNESLKAQEAQFKAACKAQMQDYNARIQALEQTDTDDSESAKKLRDIEEMYERVMGKYNRLRQMLAETNLEIASNVRVIDDVPTRTELIQYERRFSELYQQVAWKQSETKKYYAMFNSLDSTLGLMQKEVKILDSISENFAQAMRTVQGKEEFLKQIEAVLAGVEGSVKAQEQALSKSEAQTEDLRSTNQRLVDEQRRYFQAVKDFQLECQKNEWLSEKLESLRSERSANQ